uniref:Uncharacterized protein n=1 Tax=Eutreptiella gymnastica TaxID=73025 RepID=A0A7S1N6N3_9EUGL|mmetsp:Transcript_130539/g.225736  ORF Transcript_130539/g.225736 Transcript_130539/m.225736 type:complete len:210 (+) Transcript_130539:415-1044(+)
MVALSPRWGIRLPVLTHLTSQSGTSLRSHVSLSSTSDIAVNEQAALIGVSTASTVLLLGKIWRRSGANNTQKKQREKRQHNSIDEQINCTQDFHGWQRSIADHLQFDLQSHDYVNADEVPDSLVGFLSRRMKSMNDVGTDNVARLPPLTPNDAKRLCTLLIVVENFPLGSSNGTRHSSSTKVWSIFNLIPRKGGAMIHMYMYRLLLLVL